LGDARRVRDVALAEESRVGGEDLGLDSSLDERHARVYIDEW
jgi:hypothetical protein